MKEMKELFQGADWKKEKHVPAIDVPAPAKKGKPLAVTVTIGKEIPHPNTAEHHIRWIDVYFQPRGEKFPRQVGRVELAAHGASTEGPESGGVYTRHEATLSFSTEKSGTILASSFCNIHGLWQNSRELAVE
jgi:superoxide reductase